MKTIKETFNIAENLRNIRKEKGYSISYVSKQTGIPKGSIGCYESYGAIGPDRLKILCDFYNVDLDWIVEKH